MGIIRGPPALSLHSPSFQHSSSGVFAPIFASLQKSKYFCQKRLSVIHTRKPEGFFKDFLGRNTVLNNVTRVTRFASGSFSEQVIIDKHGQPALAVPAVTVPSNYFLGLTGLTALSCLMTGIYDHCPMNDV